MIRIEKADRFCYQRTPLRLYSHCCERSSDAIGIRETVTIRLKMEQVVVE